MATLSDDGRHYDENGIIEYLRYLERRVKELEAEKMALRRELSYYKSEIEKLLSPPLIEATVLEVLDDGRVIVKSSTGPNLIVEVSGRVSIDKLLPGSSVALNQRGSAIVEVLPGKTDPLVKGMEVIERPQTTFNDIGGLKEQIVEVREAVELPLKHPELFEEIGIEPPKAVLLYGPPGCGKTLLAKAVAHETSATFIRVVGSEFVQKFIGEGARIVREVFNYARRKAPSIIFIDELDAIAAKRLDVGTSGEREVQRTLLQLLAEMDGFDPLGEVKIIGATNRIDILDPAILRPGRFDKIIEIPLPNEEGRYEIFKVHTRKMKISEDVDLRELAISTRGATGADIKAICMEAGMITIRNNRRVVTRADFLSAIEKVLGRLAIKTSTTTAI